MKTLTLSAATGMIALFLPLAVLAGPPQHYNFNDVDIDGTIVDIGASVKDNKKKGTSVCVYSDADSGVWAGTYYENTVAGSDAATVLSFCVDHFEDRLY